MHSIPFGESQVIWASRPVPDHLAASKISTPDGSLPFGNYLIEYLVNDTYLEIEAEHQQTFKFYHIKLHSDQIQLLTTGLFSDATDFANVLQLALSGQDPTLSLTINDGAKLNLQVLTKIGSKDKTLTFEIQLEEEVLGELDLCKKYLQRLPRDQVENLSAYDKQLLKVVEKVIDHNSELEKDLKSTKEKLEETNKRLKALEEKLNVNNNNA